VFSAAPTEIICRGGWKHQQPLQRLFVGEVQFKTAPTVHFSVIKIIKKFKSVYSIYTSTVYTYIHPQNI